VLTLVLSIVQIILVNLKLGQNAFLK